MHKMFPDMSDAGLTADALIGMLDAGYLIAGANDSGCYIRRIGTATGPVYEMSGRTGRHSIDAEQSDARRVWKHWVGFKLNNRGA